MVNLYSHGRVDSDLGFKFALYGGGAGRRGGGPARRGPTPCPPCSKLMSIKKAGLQKLTQHHDHQEHKAPRSFCSVM